MFVLSNSVLTQHYVVGRSDFVMANMPSREVISDEEVTHLLSAGSKRCATQGRHDWDSPNFKLSPFDDLSKGFYLCIIPSMLINIEGQENHVTSIF